MKRALILFLFIISYAPTVYPQQKVTSLLTPAEIIWLKNFGQEIRYAPLPDYPPIEFVDKEGVHKGLTENYISIIEEKIGVKFKKIYLNTWNEILEAARLGKIDVLGNLQNTPERSQFFNFTRPYITIPNVIIVQKQFEKKLSLAEMEGMHVAGVKGYATIPFIQARQPGIIIQPVDNDEQGLAMVSFGQLDAMITDLSVASYTIDRLGINNLKVNGNINYDWKMCIGSRKDWPVLHTILEKALASIKQPERKQIYKKWILHEVSPVFNWTLLFVFFFAVFMITVLVLVWNVSLKRQVRLQTLNLKQELIERELITAELRTSEENFRQIFEYSPFALVHLDNQGIVIACNENFCKILGSSKNQILDFNTLQSLADAKMLAAITNALGGHERQYQGEYLSVTGGGSNSCKRDFCTHYSI